VNSRKKVKKRQYINWSDSTLQKIFEILTKRDQKKLALIVLLQISLGALDLLGVVAIGLLGSLAVSGVTQSAGSISSTNQALELLHLSDASFQTQAVYLGVGASLVLVGRTILSIVVTRRILFFLSSRAAVISANLISRLLSQSLLVVQSRTTQQNLFSITTGVSYIMIQGLATATVLIADISLLVIMVVGLLFVDTTTAVATCSLFFLIGYFLNKLLLVRAGTLGKSSSELSVRSNERIVEVFASYRESVVGNKRQFYANEIGSLRLRLSNIQAELSFLPYISKYVIETAIIVGTLIISGVQFLSNDSATAISTLAIFVAAITRIGPAVLRIQQGSITIRSAFSQASPTLDLIELLGSTPISDNLNDGIDFIHAGFIPAIQLRNISFTYPNNKYPAISEFTLDITPGSSLAFVGPSGAGKSTIVDIILGVLEPDIGSVKISGLPPSEVTKKWSGAIAYVPQDVAITAGTFRENVALGYPIKIGTDDLVTKALTLANLQEFVENLPEGMDTPVGERGTKISGGQRQRLGIARAIFSSPRLLVLDEATSSLDAETEESISNAIKGLHGSTTVVMIAHRLSTVKDADIIVYMNDGKLVAMGSFTEVRQIVPEFNLQANLMGL